MLKIKAENFIKRFTYGVIILNLAIILVALFGKDNGLEANKGEFKMLDFTEGWLLESNDGEKNVSLPYYFDAYDGEVVTIKNTLPDNIDDGNCLMLRTNLQDVYVYINDELKEQYSSDTISINSYYLPSAYVVTDLSKEDAGALITIQYRMKLSHGIDSINIYAGNNGWYYVLKENMAVNAAAFVIFVLGVILIILSIILRKFYDYNMTSLYLGLLMSNIATWMISESKLRQIIFARPSFSGYFAYMAVELIAVFVCLYFDEVQHKVHHKVYTIIQTCAIIQLVVNIMLHTLRIVDFYRTLIFSHLWMGVGLVITIINIVSDIRSKRIKEYLTTALGMLGFLVTCIFEIIKFYISDDNTLGVFICVGLVMLMVATVIQVLIDQVKASRQHEEFQTQITVKTINTIAGVVDAKDEYTGGHSERVGYYATVLAREIASEYGFKEEDIERINYIGNMHDIGKIGIPDAILNKAGKLTDEEFSIMKTHVNKGAQLINEMGEMIEGLKDGILHHHERYDGNGYPSRLKGEDIPLIARIICLADCYDAMTSNRVYRKRLSAEEVRSEFLRCNGTQFDPNLTKVFIKLMDSGKLDIL